jgi:hypothetical protein
MSIVNLNQKEIVAVSGSVDHDYGYGDKINAEIDAAVDKGAHIGNIIGSNMGALVGMVIFAYKYAPCATAASRIKTAGIVFVMEVLGFIIF